MAFKKRRVPKGKSNKFAHLSDVKKINGRDVSHMSLKEKAKASKQAQKLNKERDKTIIARERAKTKMFKKYGSDTTNIKEHDARSKIDTRDYTKRKFADAGAHVMKVSPYIGAVNTTVASIFEDDDENQ